MNLKRVLTDVKREILRPSLIALLAGCTGAAGALALLASEEHRLYFSLVYVLLPLGMAPLGARTFARDRASGMAQIHGVSPLRRSEEWLAKYLALTLFLLLAVLLTMPITAALLAGSGRAPLVSNLPFVTWALLSGSVSLAFGALLGAVILGRSNAALSCAFGLVILWMAVGESARTLLGLASSAAGAERIGRFVHLSPLTWAYDDLLGIQHPFRETDGFPAHVPVVVSTVLAVLACAVIWVRMQEPDGWHPLRRTAASGVVAAACLAALLSVNVMWPSDTLAGGDPGVRRSASGAFTVDYQGMVPTGGPLRGVEDGDHVIVRLEVHGEPGRVFTLQDMQVSAPHLRFVPAGPGPEAAEADERGMAEFTREFRVRVDYWGGHVPIQVAAVVENETFHLSAWKLARATPGSAVGILLGSLIPTAGLAATAVILPRRLNQW